MPAAQLAPSSSSHVSSPCSDVARRLLAEARQLETLREFAAAESIINAAITCDGSPEMLLTQAEFLVRRERLDEARTVYRTAWNQAALSGDKKLLSVVLHNLASVERQLGDWSTARSHQCRSMAFSFDVDSDANHDVAADLTGRALDAMASGEYGLAENLLLRSLVIERATGARDGEAADCGNLGVLAGLRGDLAVGMRFLARAYSIHRELSDDQGAGSDLMNLAELFLHAGRLSLTAKCLSRAIQNFKFCGASVSQATAELRLKEVTQVIGVLQQDPQLN